MKKTSLLSLNLTMIYSLTTDDPIAYPKNGGLLKYDYKSRREIWRNAESIHCKHVYSTFHLKPLDERGVKLSSA